MVTLTPEIAQNMRVVCESLRAIIDKDGYFEMEDLERVSGLPRPAIHQAISFLNQQPEHDIAQVRGVVCPCWCDFAVKWARRALARQHKSC